MPKFFLTIVLYFIFQHTYGGRKYNTIFPNKENPISEKGHWISGGSVGIDWGNVLTTPGKVFGDQTPGAPPYKDPTAILTGTWGADQSAQGTVYSLNPNAKYYQEVEIRLRTSISPHSITGYEIFCRCLKTGAAYVSIVRWNGPLGDFTELLHLDGVRYGVATGDILKATIIGHVITGYINGVKVAEVTDDTFSSGSPGVGFNYGVGNTNADFGFTSFSAASTIIMKKTTSFRGISGYRNDIQQIMNYYTNELYRVWEQQNTTVLKADKSLPGEFAKRTSGSQRMFILAAVIGLLVALTTVSFQSIKKACGQPAVRILNEQCAQ